jgi:hypothetical protein
MCVICVDWFRGALTTKEAARNLGEMYSSLDADHAADLLMQIQVTLIEEEWDHPVSKD